MPHADVVVIGAGLSGLVAATRLAEAGAIVTLVAKGHASTHWGSGGLDVAAPLGAGTPAEGVARLATEDHPYSFLAPDVAPSVSWLLERLEASGLPYTGTMDTPIRRVPTAIGGTRRVAIVPAAQAAALRPWEPDELLVVAGIAGFKDFWPAAIADSLGRETVWGGSDRPSHVAGVAVELAGIAARNNLNALHLARRFDTPAQRAEDIGRFVDAVKSIAGGRPGRVAVPAVFGLEQHDEAWAELRERLPLEPFEVPLVPPSIPGIRLWQALRERIRAAGGRVQVGEAVHRIVVEGGRVTAVEMEAAARSHVIRTEAVILATGGIAAGGLIATHDGRIVEPLLDLHVEAPEHEAWLVADALDPAGHPLEAAGIATDAGLRPLAHDGRPAAIANVLVAGALLAGQRSIRERCGDGIAVASGWRAANELAADATSTPAGRVPHAGRTDQ
ncbi:MAG TPA: anaerobic glycerol-3-phosphate dehydrogenase subunit GlpB [Candidatus Limnocylindrales bacterium]|nr:anaerobic glycerol-3-phosphate dehydrogenase subunit GlpB [Candidatus Limnocylindrales bacterium]